MNDRAPVTHDLHARSAVRALVASQIREVANAGMGDADILPFWFGEPDEVTPAYIRDAAVASIAAGETFYTQNFGISELREAIARYVTRLHRPVTAGNVAVTSSGMNALMLAVEALVSPGDRVVCVTPLWPNLTEIPKILGAEVVRVGRDEAHGRLAVVLEHAEEILTVGARFHGDREPLELGRGDVAHSVRNLFETRDHQALPLLNRVNVIGCLHERVVRAGIEPRDAARQLLHVQLPALQIRAVHVGDLELAARRRLEARRDVDDLVVVEVQAGHRELIEYTTSCAPVFVQRAGVTAITEGEPTVQHTLARFRAARDFLVGQLTALDGIEVASPPGAMYVFFRVAGVTDSFEFCKRLVREARLGLAPGSAFGPEGQGFVRWCFAASEERLLDGVGRLREFLARRSSS